MNLPSVFERLELSQQLYQARLDYKPLADRGLAILLEAVSGRT